MRGRRPGLGWPGPSLLCGFQNVLTLTLCPAQAAGTDWVTGCPRPASRCAGTPAPRQLVTPQRAGPDTRSPASLQGGPVPDSGLPHAGQWPWAQLLIWGGYAVPSPHRLVLRRRHRPALSPPSVAPVSGATVTPALALSWAGERAVQTPEVRARHQAGGVAEWKLLPHRAGKPSKAGAESKSIPPKCMRLTRTFPSSHVLGQPSQPPPPPPPPSGHPTPTLTSM